MRASELMTTDVASVLPEASRQEIARLLVARGISAVPVVDSNGTPLGMVSEGDLIRRGEPERQQRRDWWLEMLAEGETLSEDYVRQLGGREATARDLMSAPPLVMVEEGTDSPEIAALLIAHRIKRVPVVRDGRLVGIVSRADLLRAIAPAVRQPGSGPRQGPDRPPHRRRVVAAAAAPSARGRRARRARPYLFVARRGVAALI